MVSDDDRSDAPFKVRLEWPGHSLDDRPAREPQEPDTEPDDADGRPGTAETDTVAPTGPSSPSASDTAEPPRSDRPGAGQAASWVDQARRPTPPPPRQDASHPLAPPGPQESTRPPADSELGFGSRPSGVDPEASPPAVRANAERVARFVVEAYDRLGGQVSSDLRAMQADLDVDLGAVRSELATLRTSIGDVAERVQLRQLRTTVDELRGDITALRRAMVEAPELEQVSADVANLRAAIVDLLEKQVQLGRDVSRSVESLSAARAPDLSPALRTLQEELTDLRSAVSERPPAPTGPEPADAMAGLAALREELSGLRGALEEQPEPVAGPSLADYEALRAELVEAQVQLSDDLAEVRRALDAAGSVEAPVAVDLSPDMRALRKEVASLRQEIEVMAAAESRRSVEDRLALASMAPMIEEIGALRDEVASLRRRIPVRATPNLSVADLQREFDAAFQRYFLPEGSPPA